MYTIHTAAEWRSLSYCETLTWQHYHDHTKRLKVPIGRRQHYVVADNLSQRHYWFLCMSKRFIWQPATYRSTTIKATCRWSSAANLHPNHSARVPTTIISDPRLRKRCIFHETRRKQTLITNNKSGFIPTVRG